MKPKHIVIIVVVALAVGGAAFYGGMQFANAGSKSAQARTFGNMQGRTGMPGGAGRNGGGMTAGQVLSKDATSLTVKLNNGGSKIVFYSASTTVSKMASGTMDDVTQGSDVTVIGSTNQDGSVTASAVQLRPNVGTPPPAAK
jgi:pectate lyase